MRSERVLGFVLTSSLVAIACSGDMPLDSPESTNEERQALTTNQRILTFEGVIATGGSGGADWRATTGKAISESDRKAR